MNSIDVVAPVYNEERNIEEFISRVTSQLIKTNLKFRIILVDDGSEDASWQKISLVARKFSFVKGIKLSRNFGHHHALTAGLFYADADYTIVMDSDLQDRPEVIPKLIDKANQGFEIVFVSRSNRPESKLYLVFQKLFYKILNFLSEMNFEPSQANFSIISKKVLNSFKKFPEQTRFYGTTINWLGFTKTNITENHGQRKSGDSGYTIKKRFNLAFELIISYSAKPLKIAISIGIIFSLVSGIIGFWIAYFALTNGFTVEGWASVIISIYFTTGIILIFLGIIGTYVGRIFTEVKHRPLYVVEEILDSETT